MLRSLKEAAEKAVGQARVFSDQAASAAAPHVQRSLASLGPLTHSLQTTFDLPSECARAAQTLHAFLVPPDQPGATILSIPPEIIRRAKGLAIFSVVKAGLMFSGKAGSGLVIARLMDGTWSAPSCIATAGFGWGLQAGAELTEVVIVLNSEEAVKAFAQSGNITVGGNISASAGPIGAGGTLQSALTHPTALFTYSKSSGLFAGLSLEGTVLIERTDANKAFYGSVVPVRDILLGRIPAPDIASVLYEVIERAEGLQTDEISYPARAGNVQSNFSLGTEPSLHSLAEHHTDTPKVQTDPPSGTSPKLKSDPTPTAAAPAAKTDSVEPDVLFDSRDDK